MYNDYQAYCQTGIQRVVELTVQTGKTSKAEHLCGFWSLTTMLDKPESELKFYVWICVMFSVVLCLLGFGCQMKPLLSVPLVMRSGEASC